MPLRAISIWVFEFFSNLLCSKGYNRSRLLPCAALTLTFCSNSAYLLLNLTCTVSEGLKRWDHSVTGLHRMSVRLILCLSLSCCLLLFYQACVLVVRGLPAWLHRSFPWLFQLPHRLFCGSLARICCLNCHSCLCLLTVCGACKEKEMLATAGVGRFPPPMCICRAAALLF